MISRRMCWNSSSAVFYKQKKLGPVYWSITHKRVILISIPKSQHQQRGLLKKMYRNTVTYKQQLTYCFLLYSANIKRKNAIENSQNIQNKFSSSSWNSVLIFSALISFKLLPQHLQPFNYLNYFIYKRSSLFSVNDHVVMMIDKQVMVCNELSEKSA